MLTPQLTQNSAKIMVTILVTATKFVDAEKIVYVCRKNRQLLYRRHQRRRPTDVAQRRM
jgi:hypothetical protein